MNEAQLSSKLSKAMAEAMPGCVDFKFFDRVTTGIPDRAVTWNKKTVWLELKFDKGETSPDQVIVMRQLAQMGIAWFVRFFYMTTRDPKVTIPATLVYSPLAEWTKDDPTLLLVGYTIPVFRFKGHDCKAVAQFIRKVME